LGHGHFRTHPNPVMISSSTLYWAMTTTAHTLIQSCFRVVP